jgi:hypothetical protein
MKRNHLQGGNCSATVSLAEQRGKFKNSLKEKNMPACKFSMTPASVGPIAKKGQHVQFQ